MNDPWDDLYQGTGGFLITPSGMRIPIADAGSHLQTVSGASGLTPAGSARQASTGGAAAGYRGVGPKGYRRTDQRVREDVCERMLLDPYLDASAIAVSVSKGRVSLKGSVPSERMREGAVAVAERVAPGAVRADLRVAEGTAARGSRTKPKKTRRRARRKRGGGQ